MMPAIISAQYPTMEFDIVIVGGGLVGASLAASLRHSGLSLALVESQCSPALPIRPPEQPSPQSSPASGRGGERENLFSNDDWDSRIYAISPGSRRYLEEAGAWDHLATHRVAPVEEMRVFGDACPEPGRRDGAKLEFSAYEMGVPELACILENRELQHALWEVLRQQDNLTLLHPARCASLNVGEHSAELTLQDGRSIRAKLVVGADGRDSWVRNQIGLGATPTDYHQHGVVANFTTALPHRGIAYQWFQPEGILALLPLPGNRVSMVWSVSPEDSAGLLALTREDLCAKVAAAARHTLGEMEVITPAAAFPLRLLVLPQISAPRIALIGDAAHNMHPLAGQGVNTGFRDARELAQTLLERGGCADCGDAQLLRRYDRKRKEDIWSMQATTYGLKHLFNNDDPILRKLRNLGMDATNHLTPLKKLLVQHALN
jgi:ubiquinone biosynthesis UbiH/UbiF/VisC/COQ6 family hydroxylase